MEKGPRLVRVAEVAQVLHVSPKTIARWAKEGKLTPAFHTLGGHRMYDLNEIEALAAKLVGKP